MGLTPSRFSIGSDYHFMKLLHVAILGLSGLCGLALLDGEVGVALGRTVSSPLLLFTIWFLVFGFVGCQTAWMLRPFLGEPHLPYQLFRPRKDKLNFYLAVLESMKVLLRTRPERKNSDAKVAPSN